MQILPFLNIIRWKNLLLVIYTHFLIKIILFKTFQIQEQLSTIEYVLFVVGIVLIMAAGNIINDIFDIETDLINRPKKVIVGTTISVDNAKKMYYAFNSAGIIVGIVGAILIKKPIVSIVFIGASLLLYLYSKYLKATPLIGNLTVAGLISFSIIFIPLLDISNSLVNTNSKNLTLTLYLITFFAFWLNLIREIVKDVEDINGDYKLNMSTLPVLFGRNRIRSLSAYFTIIPSLLILLLIYNLAFENKIIAIYLLLFIFLPMLYIIQKLFKARSKRGFRNISQHLKVCMFFGINAILIIAIFYI